MNIIEFRCSEYVCDVLVWYKLFNVWRDSL